VPRLQETKPISNEWESIWGPSIKPLANLFKKSHDAKISWTKFMTRSNVKRLVESKIIYLDVSKHIAIE
jgi:hypothetical protein